MSAELNKNGTNVQKTVQKLVFEKSLTRNYLNIVAFYVFHDQMHSELVIN